jgi:glycosyltransferase involved in cell wall biosynthesis
VIIPARDESAMIGRCLEALLDGLPPGFARIIVACNGCRDDTVFRARRFASPDLEVLDLAEGGKAKAIRAAERLLPEAPRVFLDADVAFSGHDLVRLVDRLDSGPHHLISPAIHHDLQGCTACAAAVSRIWLELPHGQTSGFHHVLGVSAEGRRRWAEFPDIIADDAFIASRFRPDERRIDPQLAVTVRPPRTLPAWIGVRSRWIRGERELRSSGLDGPGEPGQRSALARLSLRPSQLPGVTLYVLVRFAAAWRARGTPARRVEWYRDATSRG